MSEIDALLMEVRAFAQSRGGTRTLAAIDTLHTENALVDVLIVAPAGVDTAYLHAWVGQTAATTQIMALSITALHSDPAPALRAHRLVIALECGKLMDADAVETIMTLVTMRPANTCAYAITHAEHITSEEDLDLVQRGFWRLFVPEPRPEWNQQSLHPYNAFLWSAEVTPDFVAARAEQDRQYFTNWLRAPYRHMQALEQTQAGYILNLAEEEVATAIVDPGPAEIEPSTVKNALESITELRRRFNRRLDADAAAIERELTVSLQTLEQKMLLDLGSYLRQRIAAHRSELDAQDLRTILTEYIREGAQKWQGQMQDMLGSRGQEIASDTQLLFQGTNWWIINKIAQRNGYPQSFPESLYRTLASSREFQALIHSPFGTPDVSRYHGPSGFGPTLRIAAAGSIAGGVTLFLLGLGPIGIITAGAAGALGGGAIHRHLQNKLSQQEVEHISRQGIKNVLRETVAQVRQQTLDTFTPLRNRVNEELKNLENMLDQTLTELRRADLAPLGEGFTVPGAQPVDTSDREQLRALRQRLIDIATRTSGPLLTAAMPVTGITIDDTQVKKSDDFVVENR